MPLRSAISRGSKPADFCQKNLDCCALFHIQGHSVKILMYINRIIPIYNIAPATKRDFYKKIGPFQRFHRRHRPKRATFALIFKKRRRVFQITAEDGFDHPITSGIARKPASQGSIHYKNCPPRRAPDCGQSKYHLFCCRGSRPLILSLRISAFYSPSRFLIAACAAAILAIGTLYGEQDT